MLIVVTGTSGQIAQSLLERGAARDVEIRAIGRPHLDLVDPTSIRSALAGVKADVIVNAAAYTAVDKAEAEPDLAMQVNGVGAGLVAACAAATGCPVIHMSTDYVFDGTLDRLYREDDTTNPVSAYGVSKLAGERAVAEANPASVILRTAWVYSPFGHNFVKTMLRLGETRDEVRVVADQRGAPTSALDIADGIISVARGLSDDPQDASRFGVFHMAGAGEAAWSDFASLIFAHAAEKGRAVPRVTPISTADYPTAAKRPANSRLDTAKLNEVFRVALPPWQESARACIDRLLTAQSSP